MKLLNNGIAPNTKSATKMSPSGDFHPDTCETFSFDFWSISGHFADSCQIPRHFHIICAAFPDKYGSHLEDKNRRRDKKMVCIPPQCHSP